MELSYRPSSCTGSDFQAAPDEPPGVLSTLRSFIAEQNVVCEHERVCMSDHKIDEWMVERDTKCVQTWCLNKGCGTGREHVIACGSVWLGFEARVNS